MLRTRRWCHTRLHPCPPPQLPPDPLALLLTTVSHVSLTPPFLLFRYTPLIFRDISLFPPPPLHPQVEHEFIADDDDDDAENDVDKLQDGAEGIDTTQRDEASESGLNSV